MTRFAPSPTGFLHLGHVVNAVYVWDAARDRGGRVLLRIEDHDRIRCRPEYEAALVEDLDWLGFVPDAGRHPIIRQSDRSAVYEDALAQLRRRHHVYACDCSRKHVHLRAERYGGPVGGECYDGHCRSRGLAEGPGRGLRVQMDDEEYGDLLLRDRDGHWTYQFAVTVDDWQQGVTLVVRGHDLLSSTGRQIALARMLGRRTPPAFLHHPLIVKPSGEKLSKSERDTGVRELRAAGLTPAEVVARAMAPLQGVVSRLTYSP